jgi:hypothetical protein
MDLIKITDSDENLEMRSYSECFNDSPQDLKEHRGLVYEKATQNVIARSFGYTDLYSLEKQEEKDKIAELFTNLENWDFFYSFEATLLRVFYYKSKWYIITHKKLDAFKSRWSCRDTFGDLFALALSKIFEQKVEFVIPWFCGKLDNTKTYFFLLKTNNENRIVCQYDYKSDKLIFLGTMESGSGENIENKKNAFTMELPEIAIFSAFSRPQKVEIESTEDLLQKTEALNHFEYQGILAMNKETFKQVRVFNTQYKNFYDLRGNNPNLRFRYLELRNDPDKLKLLYFLYPKSADIFDQYEDTLYKISRMIYHFYVNRYIKNQFITLPKEEFIIMKKCHDWYLTDRKNNRIFSKKVMEFMLEEQPLNLYKMIRRFHLNQNLAFHQNMNFKQSFMEQKIMT